MSIPSIDEDARRRFELAWLSEHPLAIEQCLPPANHSAWLGTLEELVHIELELGWKAGRTKGPLVEEYLARFPQLRSDELLLRLVQQEYDVRHEFGDRPSREVYRKRFPDLIRTGKELRGGQAPLAAPLAPEPATDMNLLFAVVALEMEYLDIAQFAAACRSWAADKTRPLADLIVERGWINGEAREEISGVMARKLKRFAGDPRATLHAAATNRVQDTIDMLGDCRPPACSAARPPAATCKWKRWRCRWKGVLATPSRDCTLKEAWAGFGSLATPT